MLRPAVYNIAQFNIRLTLCDCAWLVMMADHVSSDIIVHVLFTIISKEVVTENLQIVIFRSRAALLVYTNILASNDETSKYPGWSPKNAKSGLLETLQCGHSKGRKYEGKQIQLHNYMFTWYGQY